VSYISEVPVWKSTYRIVVPKEGKPLVQGWAIVDNTVGEDWKNVQLSLVAGAPQSFVQELSQPYYTRRAVVPLPENAMLTPQTHEATLEETEVVNGQLTAPAKIPSPLNWERGLRGARRKAIPSRGLRHRRPLRRTGNLRSLHISLPSRRSQNAREPRRDLRCS